MTNKNQPNNQLINSINLINSESLTTNQPFGHASFLILSCFVDYVSVTTRVHPGGAGAEARIRP